jgi:hypothetical protein
MNRPDRRTPEPKWVRQRTRRALRCGGCGWQVRDGHGPSCPRRFANLKTAEDIAEARAALLAWCEVQERALNPAVPQIREAFATGILARACELHLEDWQ